MDSPVKIILIVACACLADCRLRGRFSKNPPIVLYPQIEEVNTSSNADHKYIAIKKNDADLRLPEVKTGYDVDAIVFPSDDDKVYPDANKIVNEMLITVNDKQKNDSNLHVDNDESVPVPLLSIVVPPIEAKEVFTNPIVTTDKEEVTNKPLDEKYIDKDMQPDAKQIHDATENKTVIDNERDENVTLHDIEVETKSNNTFNSNETVPDFSNRFGVSNNYMLVPVNNVQSYQAIQTVSSGIPVPNAQGNPPQAYLVNYDQGNKINPLVSNNVANSQYATPNANVVSNIGTNPQYIANPDITPNMYATNAIGANNVNYNSNLALTQGNGNYVPINVPNTYMINGQLYAAVTVPNNVNVPNSLYFVNPQVSGYQVANNVPLYQLVAVNQVGNQVMNNAQVGTIH